MMGVIVAAGIACGGAAGGVPVPDDAVEATAREERPSPAAPVSLASTPLKNAAAAATPTAPAPVRDRVARLVDGFPIWIGNGNAIAVSKSLTAELYLAPYPPAPDGVMDILLLNPADGAPVTGAKVELSAEMQYMDHGVLRSVGAEGSGQGTPGGHYLIPIDLIMFGEWVMNVKVSRDNWREQFDLLVIVLP